MGATSIAWTDYSLNILRGCRRCSAGCANCYAERMLHRFSGPGLYAHGLTTTRQGRPGWTGDVQLVPEKFLEPFRWRQPKKVFVCSVSDLFYEKVPFEFIAAFFGIAEATSSTYQVLTKRPERAVEFFEWLERQKAGRPHFLTTVAEHYIRQLPEEQRSSRAGKSALYRLRHHRTFPRPWPLPNVWLGASTEDQPNFDDRVAHLRKCPAAVRFLSIEPLLGPINAMGKLKGIAWVIIGGESGPGARACELTRIESLIEAVNAQPSCALFVKQLGSAPTRMGEPVNLAHSKGEDPAEWPASFRVQDFPEVAA